MRDSILVQVNSITGITSYFKNGLYHREDGPAIEHKDGRKSWYLNGIKYSEQDFYNMLNKDFYSISTNEEGTFYSKNGLSHREDGPAIENKNGSKFWLTNGKYNREDGPACIWADGSKSWFKNNELHRLDGPAFEWADGRNEYWIEGKRYSKEDFDKYIQEEKQKHEVNVVSSDPDEEIIVRAKKGQKVSIVYKD